MTETTERRENFAETSVGARFRTAVQDDVPAVRALLVSVVSSLEIYSEQARASELGQYDDAALAKVVSDGIFVIAETDAGLAGFCFGYDDDALIWLSWFIVDPQMRMCGIGTKLIAAFLELAASRTHKVWCDTRSNNDTSKAILRKAGFDELITIPRHWYDQDFTIWQKFVA